MGFPPHIAPETSEPDPKKHATINVPEGCKYFSCAMLDEYFEKGAVYTDGQLDAVRTYRKYYLTKPFEMKWNRGGDEEPEWFSKPELILSLPQEIPNNEHPSSSPKKQSKSTPLQDLTQLTDNK